MDHRPINGTRSFHSGHPLFGFLLAHLVNGTPEIGMIGAPVLNEVLIGLKGKSTMLNGEPQNATHHQF
ncbi:inositol monophosphatase family protein [Henriciella sp. AS95]|uniref:inositol monophosphatase family protein n=1 Tax=Henriciella sp. AS95 TaxID=3135782 RepID=UPI00319E7788